MDRSRRLRDIERIEPFCNEIISIWKRYPDLRFGQLMTIITERMSANRKSFFYMEDDKLLEEIKKMFEVKE